jgi:predicted  nucleic acid-binding Zn-ribbon protein
MSEAEVILKELNSMRLRTSLSGSAHHQGPSSAANLRFLNERIHAVRYENRDLREKLDGMHKENQGLREEIERLSHEKQKLEDEVQLANERARQQEQDAHVSRRHLEEIKSSWNWRLAHAFHGVWGRCRLWYRSQDSGIRIDRSQ